MPLLLVESIKGRPGEWLDSRYDADVHTPRETLGHLISGELEDWIPRIEHILAVGEAEPFTPFDVYGRVEYSRTTPVNEMLDTFAGLRAENLRKLEALDLDEQDLTETGIHPEFGRVTLRQHLATWVAHDLYHLGQIYKSFAWVFREEIGPWQKYLNLPHFN